MSDAAVSRRVQLVDRIFQTVSCTFCGILIAHLCARLLPAVSSWRRSTLQTVLGQAIGLTSYNVYYVKSLNHPNQP